jgi:hypothetical protein
MQAVKAIGLDIAKSGFQVHGVDADGQAVIRRKLLQREESSCQPGAVHTADVASST